MNERPQPPLPRMLPEVVGHLTALENTASAVEAMKSFLLQGDERAFEHAVLLYVASAREREEAIEVVIGALCSLAEGLEGGRSPDEMLLHPTRMHELVFRAILRAFYGDAAVDRAIGASSQRKADASQHFEKGTWPKKRAD